jgi:hypothetical protein
MINHLSEWFHKNVAFLNVILQIEKHCRVAKVEDDHKIQLLNFINTRAASQEGSQLPKKA